MDFLKQLGIIGFWFFLIKGLIWLLLLALGYFGFVDKKRFKAIKSKFRRN